MYPWRDGGNGANLLTCRPDGQDWEPSQCHGLCADGACVACTPLCSDDLVCWQGECLMCKPFSLRCNGTWSRSAQRLGVAVKYNCAEQGTGL